MTATRTTEETVAAELIRLCLLDPSHIVVVTDMDGEFLTEGRDAEDLLSATMSCDAAAVKVHKTQPHGRLAYQGTFLLVFGNADDGSELVADCSVNPFVDGVCVALDAFIGEAE